jgi:type IV pilus assembly protein PilY1
MKPLRKFIVSVLTALVVCSAFSVRDIRAQTLCVGADSCDDIDIFLGVSVNSTDAPNVIFLLDNGPNWSRAAQHWPDNGGVQGQAETTAISTVLNSITAAAPVNVGLAMMTSYSGPSGSGNTPGSGGGYMRFGVRDMTVTANKTALQNMLAGIGAATNDPTEKLTGQASKEEDAALYEIYKYLSGLAPFSGPYGSGYAAQNEYVDVAGNPNTLTAANQGLGAGFAIGGNGLYQSPITSSKPCAATYIIYIANNAQGNAAFQSGGQAYYQQAVADADPEILPESSYATWTDEWTKFLRTTGVVVPAGNTNGSVITYVLDAYSAQQNVGYSQSLQFAAKQGGGKYFQVGTQAAITAALAQIFEEIQAVNSTFASAALPVNTTNRAQDKNQVFLPLFRPDAAANPMWLGNLKEYQLVNFGGGVTDLGDSGNPSLQATNTLTGFITSCATSAWTTDSGTYWQSVPETPAPKGTCPTTANSPWSDAPDGPSVEKGGVAEVIRKGNNPPTTNGTPTWGTVSGNYVNNRTVYTLNGSNALAGFTAATTGLPAALVSFIVGQDANDENGNSVTNENRPSLHGDAIHSRPVPVDYGGATGVTVYYGANDGMLHAVDAGTSASSSASITTDISTKHGAERWAFVAPEFYTPAPVASPTATGFYRMLYSGQWYSAVAPSPAPLVTFPGQPSGITPTPTPKDYYFDGSIGLYQSANNANVWIYPSMRRGGRMIYAFDVTTPGSPAFKWKFGCPNKTNDTGCGLIKSSGTTTYHAASIGETWSTPLALASIQGYGSPVIIVGAGYDTCEDANLSAPSCGTPKGAGVYVLDANTGAELQFFSTTRSVAADVAPIAVTNSGVVDHAYVVDTGGNIYRIDFGAGGPGASWVINRVAYTSGAGRKFLFAPALLLATGGTQVYVAVGSGDREHPLQSEYAYGITNRFYVYLDSLASTTATNLDDTSVMTDFSSGSTCSTMGILPGGMMKGWFMNLNSGTGEQTVTSAVIAAGLVFFSTNRPVPQSAGTCSNLLGVANGYAVNLFNASGGIGVPGASCGGTRYSTFVGGGLPPSPVLATVPVGNATGGNTQMETIVIGAAQLSGATSTTVSGQQLKPAIIPKRKALYWKSSGEN